MRLDSKNTDLTLRSYQPEDREVLQKLADNDKISRYLADRFPFPYTLRDADEWIALAQQETRPCNFVLEYKGQFAGGIGLVPMSGYHSGTAELGY